MTTFKWSAAFILILLPLTLLLTDYASHKITKTDADTATKQAALYSLKKGIQKGSLRDADLYPERVSIRFNESDANQAFEESMGMLKEDSKGSKMYVINPAERDESIGISNQPPMVAIRSNVVRDSVSGSYLSHFFKIRERYVIQSQRIAILEWKDTY
ncbi:hypothetical protein [Brevibacillus laterosporus]|uniref:Uncharacterized protein n=1 Tax=Brevibacillus laterosporus TaxID=1465 RepID=A0AAP8U686_BRELA|nr:hypothetical protein [Brevibacillus laterosporus]PPB08886.1 hypothetical protein C4A77_06260 [Brevibacillus laterosporus]